ncbi:MAG: DEAD/DEAH box helicase [Crocinitomicaceae bacterium]
MKINLRKVLTDYISIDNFLVSVDPLRSLNEDGVVLYNGENTNIKELSSILNKAKKMERETGINPLCQTFGIAQLKKNLKSSLTVPIKIQEISCGISENIIEIKNIGEPFLNPFLIDYLLSIGIGNISNLGSFVELIPEEIITDFSTSYIGNFHPHRYELIRDIEEIDKSYSLSSTLSNLLLLEPVDQEVLRLEGTYAPIVASDFDQMETLEKFKQQSILVQGPPGTGKSQLIVNTIALGLQNDKTILLSSEKRSALDAVHLRLKTLGLHRLCLTNFAKNEQKLICSDLKKTWEYFQNFKPESLQNADSAFPFNDSLMSLISTLSNHNEIWDKLINWLSESENNRYHTVEIENFSFEEILSQLSKLNPAIHSQVKRINSIHYTKYQDLGKQIKNTEYLLSELNKLYPVELKSDVDKLVVKILTLQHFGSQFYKAYGEIIASKSRKLSKLYSTALTIEKEEINWDFNLEHWIKRPSPQELSFLKKQSANQGLFNRLKFKNQWKKWVRISGISPNELISELEQFYQFEKKRNAFDLELSLLGIDSIPTLKSIYQLSTQHNQDDWAWYNSLSKEQLDGLREMQVKIQQLKRDFQTVFHFEENDCLAKHLEEMKNNLDELKDQLHIISYLPEELKRLILRCSSHEELIASVYHSFWRKLSSSGAFPKKSVREEWTTSALRHEKNKIINQRYTAHKLIKNAHTKFKVYHDLMLLPPVKLTAEKKLLRSELKKGKNILIKEFGKKKNFLTLRNLYESEARHWLLVIKPILMMHPQRISTYFPPEPGLFDIAIIDEASQMPFSHSIGTLQRAKRIMIAGDEQQMEPSSFFKVQAENDCSVFHQAKFHLENSCLTHHYRSEHKLLIEFSNKYFYQNALRCISNAKLKNRNCIQHHFDSSGIYDNGVNTGEAQNITRSLLPFLSSDSKIGVVAFSEQQIATIKNEVFSSLKSLMFDLEDQEQLVFKTLDQVQGDEFDILFISFGYGKNKEGNFELRFGPINQLGGDKRLNVLFSRAKKEIHFFSSVQLKDFGDSKNDGVNVLKKWFSFIENLNEVENEKYEISIFSILKQAKSTQDFTHLVHLYHLRGWKIKP